MLDEVANYVHSYQNQAKIINKNYKNKKMIIPDSGVLGL
jgi:hypothetical protein